MADEWQEQVGRAIRARRKELGIGPTEFANLMHVAVKTTERWERGETGGALDELDQIAKVLRTEPADLVAMRPDPDAPEPPGTPDLFAAVSPPNGNHLSDGELELLLRIEGMLREMLPELRPDTDLGSIEARAHQALAVWRQRNRQPGATEAP